jgi:hypothetical protein
VKRKKAGGPRLRRRVEEKIEKREGAPGAAGDNSGGGGQLGRNDAGVGG